MIWLLAALQLKHLVLDFLTQGPYQYLNKGKFGHPGGLLHSGLHVVATMAILAGFYYQRGGLIPNTLFLMPLAEFVIHYMTDWGKVNICQAWDLKPDNSKWYWYWLGADQAVHQLNYALILAAV